MKGFEVRRSASPIKSIKFVDAGSDQLQLVVEESSSGEFDGVWINTDNTQIWMGASDFAEFVSLLKEIARER